MSPGGEYMCPIKAFPAILLALLSPLPAPADEPVAALVDESFPLTPGGRIDADVEAGRVVIGQLLLQNMPTEGEVHQAVRPGELSRPRPVLVLSNRGPMPVKLLVQVTFEGEDGHVYMTCDAAATVRGGAINQLVDAYKFGTPMRTIDWHLVKVVHLVVRADT